MTLLTRNFFVLSFTGLWKPEEWEGWKEKIYHFYTFIVALANAVFVVSGFMAIDIKNSSLVILVDNLSLIFAAILTCSKLSCAVNSRNNIIEVIKQLENKPFAPQNRDEELIQERFDRYARYICLYYPWTFIFASMWYSICHIFIMDPPNVLLYQGWFPYNYSNPLVYWSTAFYQFCVVSYAALIYSTFDPLMPCLLCHIYAQIHILKYRFSLLVTTLEKMNSECNTDIHKQTIERALICNWVEHHIKLTSLVKTINSIFSQVMFMIYTITSLLLCTIAKVLSNTPLLSMEFAGNLFFFSAMMMQIFFQCVTVNQMILEASKFFWTRLKGKLLIFSDISKTLFNTNWFQLSNNIQKYILIILAKTVKPIVFNSGHFITLTLESFIKIIKLSYTIYNVLE